MCRNFSESDFVVFGSVGWDGAFVISFGYFILTLLLISFLGLSICGRSFLNVCRS